MRSRALTFPRDHGAHHEFRTEWWYVTGNLFVDGRQAFRDMPDFGFQLTFFRRSESPCHRKEDCTWEQSYLAHAAISDLSSQVFYHDQRTAMGGLNLAGAAKDHLRVWNGDWNLSQFGDQIVIQMEDTPTIPISLKLVSEATNGKVFPHGENGYSKKGSCSACASHYYSFPAIKLSGHLRQNGELRRVSGLGWLDHEFMTNTLEQNQTGWDWFSLTQKDGSFLMLYRVRNVDSHKDYYAGSCRTAEGEKKLISNFELRDLGYWTSPVSKVKYPIAWQLTVPECGNFNSTIRANLNNQEVLSKTSLTPSYWEGSVSANDGSVLGYAELVGYGDRIGKLF